MLEIKDTQPLKISSKNTTLSANDIPSKDSGSSMFDNMIKQSNEEPTQEVSLQNNDESHIKIVSNQQLQLQDKIKNLLNKTTNIDKIKFIKTNQDLLANATSLEQIKKVAKNLNLSLSQIAQNDNSKQILNTIEGVISKDQLALRPRASTQFQMQSFITKNDENVDIAIKKDFDNIQQNSIMDAIQLKEKVFDSKAKLQSFMSNIAKEMVENYKPPLTALKISLNPKELGSIDVVLRGNKNSMHISFQANPVTMDILTQNQADLRASLTKQFAQDQAFSFNFSQQQQHSKGNDNAFKNILFKDEDINPEDIVDLDLNIENNIYL